MSGAARLEKYAHAYARKLAGFDGKTRAGAILLSGEDADGLCVAARLVAARLCGLPDERAFDDHADIIVYPQPPAEKKTKAKKSERASEKPTVSSDDIREIVGSLYLTPFELDKRVFIIEYAESMSEKCQNMLLKSLEEPPARVVFVLCACGRLLPTVESRCTRLEMTPFTVEEVADIIGGGKRAAADVLLAARAGRGNLGMSESIIADAGFADCYAAAKRILALAGSSKNFAKTAAVYEKFKRDRVDETLGVMEYLLNDIARRLAGVDTVFDAADIDAISAGFTPLCAAKCAEHVRTARSHNAANGMVSAVMDTLILKIMEEKSLCRK